MTSNLSLLEQNRLLSQEVKRRIDQLAAINAVASAVGQSLNLDTTLSTALQVVLDVVGAEASGISLIDEEAGELVLRAQLGWVHDFVVSNPMRIPLGKGMSGRVLATNNVVVDNNLDGSEQYAVPSFREEHFRAIAMAPMRSRGEIIGILSIMSYMEDRFNEELVSVLQVIADTVGVAISNARLYENTLEQQTRVSAILHSSADGIIATDRASRISHMNQTAAHMLNVRRDDLIGIPLREASMEKSIRDVLLKSLTPEGAKAFQVTNEKERIISAVVSPVYVETQVEQPAQMDGWVIVLQDVTHLREAEIARAQFIQAAAHDMRNPLSVTLSSLLMLEGMVEKEKPTAHEIIKLALDGVHRLQGLIDDLLHLEHIESGYNINLNPINLVEILHEVSGEISMLMRDKSLTFTQDIPDTLPQINGDPKWLKRALHNYLENASKYTPETGSVKLNVFMQNGSIHIEIIDNGPGIPAKAQPKLFERFYRVEGHEKVRGSGLGLAIVKSVAETHGGTVYVRSEEGKGSTFGMTIPVLS